MIGIISSAIILFAEFKKDNTNDRDQVLAQLYLGIEQVKKEGNYKCCIEPPCTMCYLDNWIWKGGVCDCDTMIKEEKWDKVCPQCIRGIEEGRCNSQEGSCPII